MTENGHYTGWNAGWPPMTASLSLGRLKRVQDNRIIDQTILQWADGVRIVGNDAAHDLKMEITKTDAKDTLDFTEAVLLYVFVLQSRFSEFQERRKKAKESGR